MKEAGGKRQSKEKVKKGKKSDWALESLRQERRQEGKETGNREGNNKGRRKEGK